MNDIDTYIDLPTYRLHIIKLLSRQVKLHWQQGNFTEETLNLDFYKINFLPVKLLQVSIHAFWIEHLIKLFEFQYW